RGTKRDQVSAGGCCVGWRPTAQASFAVKRARLNRSSPAVIQTALWTYSEPRDTLQVNVARTDSPIVPKLIVPNCTVLHRFIISSSCARYGSRFLLLGTRLIANTIGRLYDRPPKMLWTINPMKAR